VAGIGATRLRQEARRHPVEAVPQALNDSAAFDAALKPLHKIDWVVYAKRPFAGPEAVLAYLSRYTHRVAISNSRLIACDGTRVTFKYKDYRAKGRTRHKTMSLKVHRSGPKGDRWNSEIFQDRLNGIPPLNLLSGEKAATLRVLLGVLSLDRLGAGFQHLCLHVAIGLP
jgi:hypothetical protein